VLSILVYFLYNDSAFANVLLLGDGLYKLFLLMIYHFRETPLERLTNWVLSFFTDLKTFNIVSMWKSYMDIIYDHRSVISTFVYTLLLAGFMYLHGGKIKLPVYQRKENIQDTTAGATARPTKMSDTLRETSRN
jgi:hypothetical protein